MATRARRAPAKAGAPKNEQHMLTAMEIITAADLPEAIVECPEWGGAVKVRALSYEEQREIRRKCTGRDGLLDDAAYEIALVAAGIVEPAMTKEQAAALPAKHKAPIDRIVWKIGALSGMVEGQVAEEEVARAAGSFPD